MVVVVVVLTVCLNDVSVDIVKRSCNLLWGRHVPVDMTPMSMCLCTQPSKITPSAHRVHELTRDHNDFSELQLWEHDCLLTTGT